MIQEVEMAEIVLNFLLMIVVVVIFIRDDMKFKRNIKDLDKKVSEQRSFDHNKKS